MNCYTGIVQQGPKRASALGYPTINIPLKDGNISGVYAAQVEVKGKKYMAAAFADPKRKILEAHLLDFAGNVYGEIVTMELCEKIRDSKKFDDDATLRAAIANDVAKVRQYFKK